MITQHSLSVTPETHPVIYAEARRLVGITGAETERLHQNSLQQSTDQDCLTELGLSQGLDEATNQGTVLQWVRFIPGYRTTIYRENRPHTNAWPEATGPSIFVPLDGCDNLEFAIYTLNTNGKTSYSNLRTRTSREAMQITMKSQCTLVETQMLTNSIVIDTTTTWLEITNKGHTQARFLQLHSGAVNSIL